MPLGLYISVPFCRTKCTYCNFASEVFSRTVFERYVDRVIHDIAAARETARRIGGQLENVVDSIYLGGGTPTVLASAELERMFVAISQNFEIRPDAEITAECAPGTLNAAMVDTLQRCGVNRVSLGVQSFVDKESQSVARLHTRAVVLEDIARLRAGVTSNINIDLIAGLPHQTPESWEFSIAEIIASGVPHVSVYMLEVDENSRLGRELIAGGTRYHAHFVPDEEAVADFYEVACGRLEAAGICQYEISNFAREGCESRHNLKYWTRQPYLGFGVDAHSMLLVNGSEAVRFASTDSLEDFVAGQSPALTPVSGKAALEEVFFLGLRLNRGVDLVRVTAGFGREAVEALLPAIADLKDLGLLHQKADVIRLTPRGRLLSNEVFERFITVETRLAAS